MTNAARGKASKRVAPGTWCARCGEDDWYVDPKNGHRRCRPCKARGMREWAERNRSVTVDPRPRCMLCREVETHGNGKYPCACDRGLNDRAKCARCGGHIFTQHPRRARSCTCSLADIFEHARTAPRITQGPRQTSRVSS